jgi:homoserine kinase type II
MNDILNQWNITAARIADEHAIPGSPERCIERTVIEDTLGRLWLLERLAAAQAPHRESVAALLHSLHAAGTYAVHSPAALAAGRKNAPSFIARVRGAAWQLSPFITGSPLPRPEYIDHAWRGEAAAAFIYGLQTAGKQSESVMAAPTPPLSAYIDSLMRTMAARHPRCHRSLAEPARHAAAAAARPVRPALAHGDLHPVNIIWNTRPQADAPCVQAIAGVIDWEFCGLKDVLYDVSNCAGCAGFEHPSALEKDFVLALMAGLLRNNVLSAEEIKSLPAHMVALRFAWVSEWLRRNDMEMLHMETEYLNILLDNGARLGRLWAG